MKKVVSLLLAIIMITGIGVPACAAQTTRKNLCAPPKNIFSDAYVLVSLNEDEPVVIAEKNENKIKYPASLTKIVTAMVVLEQVDDLKKQVTVSKSAVKAIQNTGAQHAGLKEGTKISVEQLLYLSLLFSACDACRVLAETVGAIAVKDGRKTQTDIVLPEMLKVLLPNEMDISEITIRPVGKPAAVTASVETGKTVCKAVVVRHGEVIARTHLVTKESVKYSAFCKRLRQLKEWVKDKFYQTINGKRK